MDLTQKLEDHVLNQVSLCFLNDIKQDKRTSITNMLNSNFGEIKLQLLQPEKKNLE